MQNTKGIILAGGSGTRLYPVTSVVSKQLLPIYNKPMIYYPLSVLFLSKIRDILIISTPQDINAYKRLLGNGKQLGVKFSYKIQKKPGGLAEAFIIGKKFIEKSNVALILGDNIFYGNGFSEKLKKIDLKKHDAEIFVYEVKNPERYGVLKLDKSGKALNIVEKPKKKISNLAVTGIYFYTPEVLKIVKKIKPSKRGELEITDINNYFIKYKKTNINYLGRGYAWLDTGTFESLLDSSNFVQTIENRTGHKVACLEEIAFNYGWINTKQLLVQVKKYKNSSYGDYLNQIFLENENNKNEF